MLAPSLPGVPLAQSTCVSSLYVTRLPSLCMTAVKRQLLEISIVGEAMHSPAASVFVCERLARAHARALDINTTGLTQQRETVGTWASGACAGMDYRKPPLINSNARHAGGSDAGRAFRNRCERTLQIT